MLTYVPANLANSPAARRRSPWLHTNRRRVRSGRGLVDACGPARLCAAPARAAADEQSPDLLQLVPSRRHARDRGEALSIRQMVDRMVRDHGIDPKRVFVTGLSAGGAMTSVMLATYPEVFAGGAIVAGLPYGTAARVAEAFESMFQGTPALRRRNGATWCVPPVAITVILAHVLHLARHAPTDRDADQCDRNRQTMDRFHGLPAGRPGGRSTATRAVSGGRAGHDLIRNTRSPAWRTERPWPLAREPLWCRPVPSCIDAGISSTYYIAVLGPDRSTAQVDRPYLLTERIPRKFTR